MVHQFSKNFAGINFRKSPILKNSAEFIFANRFFQGPKKEFNFVNLAKIREIFFPRKFLPLRYAYENISGSFIIRKIAREVNGASGPSNLDSDGWKRILTSSSFGTYSNNLCESIAALARKLCFSRNCANDDSLEALLASKLIPLDKNPGLRPIGVGEVLRRIIGRAVMRTCRSSIIESAGDLQLCAGQQGGCEALVHAMADVFDDEECDAVLLVDADNAFNRINRKVVLHNIKVICPIIATYAINCYQQSGRLFVTGGIELSSDEGTTQGDPAAMPLYALGTIPLLQAISTVDTIHAAFADDLTAGGKIKSLLIYWQRLIRYGPKTGYFPKPAKSWLIVKPEKLELAKMIFRDTEIKITAEGQRHLGAVIGDLKFKQGYIDDMVSDWVKELNILADVAKFHPQSAYCAYTAGYRHKFNYFMRTLPGISTHLQAVENVIRNRFLPSLFENRQVSDDERALISLPAKLGGLGIPDVTKTTDLAYCASRHLTSDLVRKVVHQNESNILEPATCKGQSLMDYNKSLLLKLRNSMSPVQLKANDICQADGASIWLTSLPLRSEGHHLSKREFVDAIYLRYGWQPNRLPLECACSSKFSIDHSMSCKVGGFIHLRHNDLLNITDDLLSKVCTDVDTEPPLQSSTAGTEELRADIVARGFWQPMQRAFMDVRVFYPFAPSYRNQSLAATMKSMEGRKKRKYMERILNEEYGTFTPLVFSSSGGMSKETKRFFQRLAELISIKTNVSLPETSAWLKRKLSFSLVRSSVICLRGSRSHRYKSPQSVQEMDILSDTSCINVN